MLRIAAYRFIFSIIYIALELAKYISLMKSNYKYTEQCENATPELFAIYIQNYANQECK